MQKCFGYFKSSPARLLAGLVLGLFAFLPKAYAQTRSEQEIKALFYVTMARYIEWPSNAFETESSPIVIGVIGDNPFGKLLESLTHNETVRGRPLVVRQFGGADEIKECHLLYFGEMNVVRRELVLSRVRKLPILTVSDVAGFTREGGAVELYLNEENKVRLRVSEGALKEAKLSISPTILRLAKLVAFIEWLPSPAGPCSGRFTVGKGRESVSADGTGRGG